MHSFGYYKTTEINQRFINAKDQSYHRSIPDFTWPRVASTEVQVEEVTDRPSSSSSFSSLSPYFLSLHDPASPKLSTCFVLIDPPWKEAQMAPSPFLSCVRKGVLIGVVEALEQAEWSSLGSIDPRIPPPCHPMVQDIPWYWLTVTSGDLESMACSGVWFYTHGSLEKLLVTIRSNQQWINVPRCSRLCFIILLRIGDMKGGGLDRSI